ncbi:MAG: hypothetical protein HY699_04320 [Deltaproteobacteria bacterium]|nr:hypothetical protein [Deltaproteobacteria bacterium]
MLRVERSLWTWEGPGVPMLLGAVLSGWVSIALWVVLCWLVWRLLQ